MVFSLRAGDRVGESTALTLIGNELRLRGDLPGAESHLLAALKVAEKVGNRTCQAAALSYLGDVAHGRGTHWIALNRHRRAIGLWRSVGRLAEVAKAQMRLGTLYVTLGKIDNALDLYRQALPELEKVNDIVELGKLHSRIGEALIKEEQTAESLRSFANAFSFREKADDLHGQGVTLQGRGLAHWLRGELPQAKSDHERALAIFHRLGDSDAEATAWLHIGVVQLQEAQADRALLSFQRALPTLQNGADREAESLALYGLALAERQRGNASTARTLVHQAIELAERVRRDAVRSDLQALYFATKQDYYDLLLSLIAVEPNGLESEGIGISERVRSRSLLDLLSATSPPLADRTLLAEKREMEARLERVGQAILKREMEGRPTDDLNAERRMLLEEIQILTETIRQSSPWVKQLTDLVPVSVKEIQSELLDDDTVLLEYFVGHRRSYLWVVSRTSVQVFKLPGRAALEDEVRPLAGLSETSHMRGSRRRLQRQLRSLSRLLLEPAAAHLEGKRLVIVPHGPLLSISFAALPTPHGRQAEDGWDEPLVARHEIVQLPSMSVLEILRANQARKRRATRQIAVFANPAFPRASEDSAARFPPLPRTRKEAAEIRKLAGNGDVFMALGRQANKEVVESGVLEDFRFIHFGTHLRLEPALPELSGLVLSSVTEDGRPVDAFLRPYEISDLELRAELVMLAACRSALGRAIPGEGRLGLSQAFFHAGATRVIQSLWDVNDEATAEMTRRFYRGLLQDSLPPAAALRRAQVEMWQSSRWRPPGYWAGFFIEGDWR